MTVDRGLDTFTGTYLEWAGHSSTVSANPALPERSKSGWNSRTIRLPRSAAVLFLVRTQFLSLSDISRIPGWRQPGRILAELPEDTVEYNGVSRYGRADSGC